MYVNDKTILKTKFFSFLICFLNLFFPSKSFFTDLMLFCFFSAEWLCETYLWMCSSRKCNFWINLEQKTLALGKSWSRSLLTFSGKLKRRCARKTINFIYMPDNVQPKLSNGAFNQIKISLASPSNTINNLVYWNSLFPFLQQSATFGRSNIDDKKCRWCLSEVLSRTFSLASINASLRLVVCMCCRKLPSLDLTALTLSLLDQ